METFPLTRPTATRTEDGKWQVTAGATVLAGPFATMADAWRWIDRHEGEPISPAEKRGDWIADKIINGATGL